MNDDLQQLKAILQVLALPVLGQVRRVGGDCARVERLAEAFDATYHAVHTQVGRERVPEQARTLARLDDQLGRLRRQSSSPLCTELVMRQSGAWRRVRMLAREALAGCRWTLEVPPVAALNQEFSLNELSFKACSCLLKPATPFSSPASPARKSV